MDTGDSPKHKEPKMTNKIDNIKAAELKLDDIRKAVNVRVKNGRSRWRRVVKAYALDLLEDILVEEPNAVTSAGGVRALLLNGAADPAEFSWGGCSIVYTAQIWSRLLPPSWSAKKGNAHTLTKSEARRLVGALSSFWASGNGLARSRRNALDIQAAAIADALDIIESISFELAKEA